MSRARTNKENRAKRPSTLGLLLGGTGGRKDASKGAEAERQRRRRERDRSREMAAYVGYDAMYRDGIAQVMPGMFSQTVEFSDISYQSARKEARETAFTVMSSLFNYFPADSHVQLQVVNAPIPADEVGRKVFFEPGESAAAGLAAEYNRILNDKMREGVSNLVRHRYLTYAVGADDVDAAVPKLARIRGDVEQTLARIRCSSRALDGAERLELLQGQLRPGSRFEFSWDKLSPTSGARTKDFVMPSTLDFKPEGRSDCFCSDGRYGAVLAVRSFRSDIEETYLATIIDLPLPLIEISQRMDGSQSLPGVKEVVFLLVFFAVFLFLIQNSFDLMASIYEVCGLAIDRVEALFGAGGALDLPEVSVVTTDDDIPSLIAMLVVSLISWVVVLAAYVVALVVCWARALQLYIMAAFAPIPLAFLGMDATRQIGLGYLKSFGAVCIAGVIILVLLISFPLVLGGLTGANPGTGTPADAVANGLTYALQYLAMCVLLILALVKSGSWARDIVSGF